MSYTVNDEKIDMTKLNYIDRIIRKIEEIETYDNLNNNNKKKNDDCYVHTSFIYLTNPSHNMLICNNVAPKSDQKSVHSKQDSAIWSATSSKPSRNTVSSFSVEKNLYHKNENANLTYSSSDSGNMVKSKRLTIPEIRLPKESNGKIEISEIEEDVTDDEKDIVKKNEPNSRAWQPSPKAVEIVKPEPIKPPTPKPTLTAKTNTSRPPSVLVNTSKPLQTVNYVKQKKSNNSFRRFLSKINPMKKRN